MKKTLLAALSVLFGSIALATETQLPVPQLETLPNGLEVIWFQNDKLPLVDFAILVKSGFRDDPAGKSGTAEVLSKILDRGPELEALGATRYVTPDEEFFTLGVHGLATDAPVLLRLLAKMALQPDFSEQTFQREKNNLFDSWSHLADSGGTLVELAFRRLMTAGSPYWRGQLQSASEFQRITPADPVAFHRAHFTPKNSVLVAVGRVDRAAIRAPLAEAFGGWTGEVPKSTTKPGTDKRLPSLRSGQVLVVNRPQLGQAQIRIGFKAPAFNHPDQYTLAVINAFFGEYFESRLNASLRDKLGLTYSISSSINYNRELGTFSIATATRNGNTGTLLRKALDALKQLRTGPVSDQEIETAKTYLIGGFPLGTASLGAVASRWTVGHVLGLDPDFLNQFVPKVRAVTRAEVEAAIRKHFNPAEITVVVAGDAKQIQAALKEEGGFSTQVISPKELF